MREKVRKTRMNEQKMRLRNAGFVTFFFSGICAISSGVVVSLLQEQYGFAYGMTVCWLIFWIWKARSL